MPFALSHVADLLEALEGVYARDPPLAAAVQAQKVAFHIKDWFTFHLPVIGHQSHTLVCIFSFLLPELRADRTYALRENALARIIGRCMLLGQTRQKLLDGWRTSKSGDLAIAVQRVMAQTESRPVTGVTVEEMEYALDRLAARCRFSSERLRARFGNVIEDELENSVDDVLRALWRRLNSVEGKWVVRAMLKSHLPLVLPENHTLSSYHFLLPYLFSFQHDLEKACELLETPEFYALPHHPLQHPAELELVKICSKSLKPEVGIKVGRPEFVKARSCKNAAELAAGRRISMERKYDGEYCQIHIDLEAGAENWLKIFSKSGRDSTKDRVRVHRTIREALLVDKPKERGHWTKCILEGELLVYNDRESRIMEFHHLRSHVSRAGTYIGAANDPRPDRDSHLMLVLFDCLLLGSRSLLHVPHSKRMEFLGKVLQRPIPGRCELAEREELNFTHPNALERLREAFAAGIVKRWEGFILKPVDEPYLDLAARRKDGNARTHGWVGGKAAWIKLKKDYIQGCGDVEDFCIVVRCGTLSIFHVACLVNKGEVQRFAAKPRLRLVFEVTYNITKQDLAWINRLAYFDAVPYKPNDQPVQYDLDTSNSPPTLTPLSCIFTTPLVFEIAGGGFEKQTNCTFYTPRHPRVCKIHWDRSYMESICFGELQQMAEDAMGRAEDGGSEDEEKAWIEKLIKGDGGKRGWGDGPLGDATYRNNQRDSETKQHKGRPQTPPSTQQTSTTHRSSPPSPPSQSSKRAKTSSPPSEGRRRRRGSLSTPPKLQSPLFDAEVFLPRTLLKFPSLLACIALHSPHSVLPLTSDDGDPPPPSARNRIVLIEAHRQSHARAVIKGLYRVKEKAEQQQQTEELAWEVYDWRVVGEGVVDWSLHHACTV